MFAIPLDRDVDVDDAGRPRPRRHGARRAARRASRGDRAPSSRAAPSNDDDRSGFDDAVAAAAARDVAVLVMGERAGLTEDCTTGESRDVSSLDLPGVQEELGARGRRHRHAGRARARRRPADRVAERCTRAAGAVLDGLAAGRARRGGDRRRAGRATSAPAASCRSATRAAPGRSRSSTATRCRAAGRTGRAPTSTCRTSRCTRSATASSYSTFELGVEAHRRRGGHGRRRRRGGASTVTNTGGREADEVVQLYTRDPVASVTRPVLELQAFRRVALDAGARRTRDVPRCRSPRSASPAPTCATSSSPATSSSSSARRPPPLSRRGASSWRRRRGRRGAHRPPTSRPWSGSEPAGRRQLGRQRHVRRHRRRPAAHRRRGAGGRRRRGPAGRTRARRRGAAQLHGGGRHRRSAGRHRRAPRGGRRRRDRGDGDRRGRHSLRRAGAVPRRARVGARSTCRRCLT